MIEMGINAYQMQNWEGALQRVEEEAARRSQEHQQQGKESWKQLAADAFLRGARQAHRFTKIKAQHEVLQEHVGEQPHQQADTALEEWDNIWQHHGLAEFQRPPPEAAAQ